MKLEPAQQSACRLFLSVRKAISVLVTLALSGVGQPALAEPNAPVGVTVRLRDNARVPVHVLMRALGEVTRIYRQAGVETVWPTSPRSESKAVRQTPLTVVILSNDQVERLASAAVPGSIGGVARGAPGRGRVAYVFYDRIQVLTGPNRLHRAQVLAIAIAHEIGHLLLPRNTHSKAGLMRANWTSADLRLAQHGRLLFTTEEAGLLRSRILASRKQDMVSGPVVK